MRFSFRPAVALVAGLLCLTGCGPVGPKPVAGTITVDGKPLARVVVSLVPEAGGGSGLSGSSDDQGNFSLLPAAGQEVVPGNYKVVVSDPNAKAGGKAARADDPYSAGQNAPTNPTIPAKYSSAQTTTAKATVEPGKPLAIDLPPK